MAIATAPADSQDKPAQALDPELGGEPTTADAPEVPDKPDGGENSFPEFDPSQVPEDADRDWLGNKYNELRTAFTQKTQSLAEERREAERAQQIVAALQNPEQAPEILRIFGYDLGDDEEPEDLFDEDDPNERIARVEQEFEAYQSEQQAIMQMAAEQEALTDQIEELEQAEGREFDPEEVRLLTVAALNNADAQGVPDVKAAFGLLTGAYNKRQEAWRKSKQAPRRPGSGTPGSKAADLSKPDERRRTMVEAAEEAMASAE